MKVCIKAVVVVVVVVVAFLVYTYQTVLELNCCCTLNEKHVYSLNIALRYNIEKLWYFFFYFGKFFKEKLMLLYSKGRNRIRIKTYAICVVRVALSDYKSHT